MKLSIYTALIAACMFNVTPLHASEDEAYKTLDSSSITAPTWMLADPHLILESMPKVQIDIKDQIIAQAREVSLQLMRHHEIELPKIKIADHDCPTSTTAALNQDE